MNRALPQIERHGRKSLLRRAPRHIVYQDIDMIKFIEASLHDYRETFGGPQAP